MEVIMDISKITQTIDELLNYISQKLEVPIQMAQEILYKEYTYKMWLSGIGIFVGICLLITIIVAIKKSIKPWSTWTWEKQFWLSVVLCIMVLVDIILLVNCVDTLLHGLISPEIYMWQKIIQPMLQ